METGIDRRVVGRVIFLPPPFNNWTSKQNDEPFVQDI